MPSAVTLGFRARLRSGPSWARRALILSVGGGFLSQATLVLSGILVARTLGVTDRGHFALLVVIPSALAFIGALGVPDALAYFISRDPSAARTLLRRVLRLIVAQACVLVLLNALFLWLVFRDEGVHVRHAALIMIAWIPGAIAYQYGLSVVQARRRFVAFNVLRIVPLATYSALVVVVILLNRATVAGFALAWVVAFATAGIASASLALSSTRDAREPSSKSVRDIASFGARGVVGTVSLAEGFRVDQLVAGLFLGAAPLGLYAVASSFMVLPMVVALSIGMVEYVHVAPGSDAHGGRRTVLRYLGLTLVICGAIVAALELILPTLLPLLFGDEFADAVPAARILLLGAIALAARRILSDGLRALGRPTMGTYAELLTLALLVTLLSVLAPIFGISGVAAAVAVSTTVGALFLGVSLARFEPRVRESLPVAEASRG